MAVPRRWPHPSTSTAAQPLISTHPSPEPGLTPSRQSLWRLARQGRRRQMARRAASPLLANSRPAQICRRPATRRRQSAASAAGAGQCTRHSCALPCRRRGLSQPPRRRPVVGDAGQLAGATREAHFCFREVALGASGAVRALSSCVRSRALAPPPPLRRRLGGWRGLPTLDPNSRHSRRSPRHTHRGS